MDDFEKLLMEHKPTIDRFVYYKLASRHDAEDILQKTYLTAQIKFHTLRDRTAFKAWGIAIARNLCNEYFKEQAKLIDIPLDDITEKQLVYGSQGITEIDAVHETLDKLKDKDKQILYLYFFLNFSYSEIAQRLNIPEGTVKSRLHSAKEHFKEKYPYPRDILPALKYRASRSLSLPQTVSQSAKTADLRASHAPTTAGFFTACTDTFFGLDNPFASGNPSPFS